MKIGSLFAGIGGFDLAARWMGWETAWFSEIDPYASAVLKKHWPDVPNHGDITGMKGGEIEDVDIICGGFPCQDVSLIGEGAGLDGARSGLWSEYARLIEELYPRFILAENVSALRTRGLDRVLGSLDALGYDAEWHCIPAAAVGAPHQRDRIWIIGERRTTFASDCVECPCECDEPWCAFHEDHYADCPCIGPHSVADSGGEGLEGHTGHGPYLSESGWLAAQAHGSTRAEGLCGERYPEGWWATEPNVGRVAHGVPSRVDRLRCLGNALVPQVAYQIFQALEGSRYAR